MSERNKFVVCDLNEVHLTTAGKFLLAGIGAWLLGKTAGVILRGSKPDVDVVLRAMIASKRFQDELRRPGASVATVVQKLNVKNMTAADFKRAFSIDWPF